MNCPSCGRPLSGEPRCSACGTMLVPPSEGALAPDPSGIGASSRNRIEPLREIPALRKKERTWKDEVRERVKDRRRRRGGDGELPLFREPDEAAAKPASVDAVPGPEPPSQIEPPAFELEPPSLQLEPIPLGDSEPEVASSPVEVVEETLAATRDEDLPLDLEIRPAETVTLDEPLVVSASEALEPEPERVVGNERILDNDEDEWPLELARPREEARRLERPATLLDRVCAGGIDLVPLSVLWAIVVYFAGRTAQVSLMGLLPGAGYLLGFLAFLGLVYAGCFTGTTGQTLGKIVCRLRVVDAAGQPPGSLRAFARSAVGAIGILLAGAGMVSVFFDPARRALHDRIFKTRVVKF